MEDIRKAAIAHYERADSNQQQVARQFFNKMDKDGNGKISHNEFMEALKQLGYKESEQNELANLFEKLDTNGDRHLDFYEALAFYHAIMHKTTHFCSCCLALLAGTYFSCLECHVKEGNTYDLCIGCYRKGKSDDHMHKSLHDNHHLLQIYRNLVANGETNRSTVKGSPVHKAPAVYGVQGRIGPTLGSTANLVPMVAAGVSVAALGLRLGSTSFSDSTGSAGLGLGPNARDIGSADPSLAKDAGDIGSADPSLAQDAGDIGSAGFDLAEHGSSLADIAQHGSSLADIAQHGSSLADIAQHSSSLADIAQHGSSLADIAQSGSALADIAQQGLSLAPDAINLISACSIM